MVYVYNSVEHNGDVSPERYPLYWHSNMFEHVGQQKADNNTHFSENGESLQHMLCIKHVMY